MRRATPVRYVAGVLFITTLAAVVWNAVPQRRLHIARSVANMVVLPQSADEQTIAVDVPAGPLTVTPSSGLLVLRRMGVGNGRSIYRGVLEPVRVTDTRGSLPGWYVYVSFSASDPTQLTGAELRVRPGYVVAVSGDDEGVAKARASWTRLDRSVALFGAEIGYGHGTYEDGAGIEVALPPSSSFGATTITLSVSVTAL